MEPNFECQPEIKKFVNMFAVFLECSHLPHYTTFPTIKQLTDLDYVNYVISSCIEFIDEYIKANLDHTQKHKIITEYGMKKLIDLQVSYEGFSICEELLNFDEHINTWLQALLMNVVMLN